MSDENSEAILDPKKNAEQNSQLSEESLNQAVGGLATPGAINWIVTEPEPTVGSIFTKALRRVITG